MKETSRIRDILISIVRSSREEFQKIKWEELNVFQKLVQKQKISLSDPKDESYAGAIIHDTTRKAELDSPMKEFKIKASKSAKPISYDFDEAPYKENKSECREASGRQMKGKMLMRSLSKTGKRTLPSSPSFKTTRFDLNRISSKRRKLPQPPGEKAIQEDTQRRGKSHSQERKKSCQSDKEMKKECSSTRNRRPLRDVPVQEGFVRPSAWVSCRPQIIKQGDNVPFYIPTERSPVANRQKVMPRRCGTISLKNENTEYERDRLLSFRTFFRREFENYNKRDQKTTSRSSRLSSATDELETYLVNRKLQRACHDIL